MLIGSAVFDQLTVECPYTLQWVATSPRKLPLPPLRCSLVSESFNHLLVLLIVANITLGVTVTQPCKTLKAPRHSGILYMTVMHWPLHDSTFVHCVFG